MSAIPGGLHTDSQPPMTVPLRHFLVGLGFLVAGTFAGLLVPLGVVPGRGRLVHVHLLLAGWVCVTILGAMTQFVPVWSGTPLYSRRLATLQLQLVTGGLVGFVAVLLVGPLRWLALFGALLLAGFWTFVYNVGRTLVVARPWDVTERHFALALCFLVVTTLLGLVLAAGYARPVAAALPVARPALRAAHATLAVFGVVTTTVVGALYQLATMFTQSDLRGVDHHLRRAEEVGYPAGVVALAAGRLVGNRPLASVGGLLVVATLLGVGVVLARRLYFATVRWTPMLRRYAVVAASLVLWAVLAAPAMVAVPLGTGALFGGPAVGHLFLAGVVGFVVLGTLYHVVPFVVWVHRYSDRLGYEPVPMVDDLYDDRLARVDLAAVLAGSAATSVGGVPGVPPAVRVFGGVLATAGVVVFATNLALVVREHGPHSLAEVLLGVRGRNRAAGSDSS